MIKNQSKRYKGHSLGVLAHVNTIFII